jgi:NADH-quinone oxidoreductase subunit C
MSATEEGRGFQSHGSWAGADLVETLRERFDASVLGDSEAFGEREITVRREILPALARLLKEEEGFEYLMDLTAVDYLGQRDIRFELVAHFYSLSGNRRLRVCVPVKEDHPEVPSLTGLWKAADWFEREIWDLYGIRFAGHPDLRRLLLYDEFKGHPLRKDYKMKARQPLIGPGSPGHEARLLQEGDADV